MLYKLQKDKVSPAYMDFIIKNKSELITLMNGFYSNLAIKLLMQTIYKYQNPKEFTKDDYFNPDTCSMCQFYYDFNCRGCPVSFVDNGNIIRCFDSKSCQFCSIFVEHNILHHDIFKNRIKELKNYIKYIKENIVEHCLIPWYGKGIDPKLVGVKLNKENKK